MLTFFGPGVKKRWAIPVFVEATNVVGLLGSGMSVRYFPLFFARELGLTPLCLSLLGAAEQLGLAFLAQLTPSVARRFGRACASLLFIVTAPLLLLAMASLHRAWLAVPLFVLRTATARASIPLHHSIIATCVPAEHRGKFAGLLSLRTSLWSLSAFLGARLADRWGSYRPVFVATACWQLFPSAALFLPVVSWLPRTADEA